MAFGRKVWFDRVVQRARTYQVTENQDNTITLTPEPGGVTQEGTPLSAANLNLIERMAQHYSAAFDYYTTMIQAMIRSLQKRLDNINTRYDLSEINTKNIWIDGKTIYQRTITFTTTGTSDDFATEYTLDEADTIISIDGIFHVTNGPIYSANCHRSSSRYYAVYFNENKKIYYHVSHNGTFTITVTYTK